MWRKDDPGRVLTIPETMISGGIAGGASVFGNTVNDKKNYSFLNFFFSRKSIIHSFIESLLMLSSK